MLKAPTRSPYKEKFSRTNLRQEKVFEFDIGFVELMHLLSNCF